MLRRVVLAAAALTLAGAASAVAAPTGAYQGIVDGSPHGPRVCGTFSNEGEGWFRVKGSGDNQRLVDPGDLPCRVNTKLTAPAFGSNCHELNIAIPHSIPLRNNAFAFSGKLPVGHNGSNRFVQFKGHFDRSSHKFAGFTRVVGKDCDSGRMHWHMSRISS
jgi:hypothetical protein